jgi:four helix bundle protein
LPACSRRSRSLARRRFATVAAAAFAALRTLTDACARGLGAFALAKRREAKGTRQMLIIYDVIIEVLRLLRPVVHAIEKHDRDLARQLKRASTSVLLNAAEGSGTRGGSRMERYRTALGSARETTACIDASLALGYIDHVDAELLDKLDRVRGTLVRLTR